MDLDLPIRTLGRSAVPISVEIIGEIEESDVALLQTEGRSTGAAVRVTELRDRHHSVARLLALGHKPWEVSAITGYSASWLSVLQDDPAFKDLLAHYRGCADSGVADIAARVKDAAATAVSKVVDRLENDPTIEFADLSKTAKDMLDRAGFRPKSIKELNVNIGLADRVEAARQRALASRQAIPHEVTPLILDLEAAE